MASTRPRPRLRNVSCMRVYSPLSTILLPFQQFVVGRGGIEGDPVSFPAALPNSASTARHVVGHVSQVAARDAHRQVDRRLQVRVSDLGGHGGPAERDDVLQRDRAASARGW